MSVLTLGEVDFPLRDELPKGGRFLVLSKKMSSKAANQQMTALYDFVSIWIEGTVGTKQDGTEVDFDDALAELEIPEIQAAIAEAVKQFTKRPTTRSSASADGSLPMTGTSKVVSLGKGTVRLVDESQTA